MKLIKNKKVRRLTAFFLCICMLLGNTLSYAYADDHGSTETPKTAVDNRYSGVDGENNTVEKADSEEKALDKQSGEDKTSDSDKKSNSDQNESKESSRSDSGSEEKNQPDSNQSESEEKNQPDSNQSESEEKNPSDSSQSEAEEKNLQDHTESTEKEENSSDSGPKDWSKEKCVHYKVVESENTPESLDVRLKLDMYFKEMPKDTRVKQGDTLVFQLPEKWFAIEDTPDDKKIPIYAGDIRKAGNKDAAMTTHILAEYRVKNQKVELTFCKYASQIEDISAVFGRIELSVVYNVNSLKEKTQEVIWKIQTYDDGTTFNLQLTLPAWKDDTDSESDEKNTAADTEDAEADAKTKKAISFAALENGEETVSASIKMKWDASSGAKGAAAAGIEFTLYVRPEGEESYEPAKNDKGDDIKVKIEDFGNNLTGENQAGSLPKYDEDGKILEYKWVETKVYNKNTNEIYWEQGKDSSNTFEIVTDEGTFRYILEKEKSVFEEAEGTFQTEITNRLYVDYHVKKIWTEQPPEGTSANIKLYRQGNNSGANRPITVKDKNGKIIEFALDGTPDSEPIEFTVDGHKAAFLETKPWEGVFRYLPEYGTDGEPCIYGIYEAGIDGWQAAYSDIDSYTTEITNSKIDTSTYLNVRKRWYDDGVDDMRQKVVVTAYEKKDNGSFEKVTYTSEDSKTVTAEVTLTAEDFWRNKIAIPKDKKDKVIIVETAMIDASGTRTELPIPSSEQLDQIWDHLKNSDHNYGTGSEITQVQVGENTFNQWYTIETFGGSDYYTVINQPVEGQETVIASKTDLKTISGSYPQMTQDIYVIDNNNQAGRFTKEEFREAFLKSGKITLTYTTADGKTKTVDFLPTSLLDSKDIIISESGGTGHYVLSIPEGRLPKEAVDADGNAVSLDWSFTAHDDLKKFTSDYYFVDVNEETKVQYTTSDIGTGWYFTKTFEYETTVVLRTGDKDFPEGVDVEQCIKDNLTFNWKQTGRSENFTSISITQLMKTIPTISNLEYVWEDNGNGTYSIKINHIPRYRVDGTEYIYYVDSKEDADTIDPSSDSEHPDWLSVSFNNTNVSNHGDQTDRAYAGGEVILTLTGHTSYTGNKVWRDGIEANKEDRPELTFHLWRYTARDGADFKSAAPVKNNNGQGDILILNVPAGYDRADEFKNIDFKQHLVDKEVYPDSAALDVLLGENEELPKYDSEGYPYVYFLRETMGENGSENYVQIYGEVTVDSSGKVQIQDTLAENVETRKENDSSVYNGGTITNLRSDETETSVQKRWVASSFQHNVADTAVEFELQVRRKNEKDEYEPARDEDGHVITCRMQDFHSETMTSQYSTTMPKYDYAGYELEYRWVETGVFYQEDFENNLLEIDKDGNKTFEITDSATGKKYYFRSETVQDQNGESIIENRIADTVDYKVAKKWVNSNGEEIDPPTNAKLILKLYRKNGQGTLEELTAAENDVQFILDGSIDTAGQDFTVDERTVTYKEDTAWHGSFEGLPKYDADGKLYDYVVFETDNLNWEAEYRNKFDTKTDTYTTELINWPPGEVQYINVGKQWLDDSDVDHRGEVKITLYERKSENKFEPIELEEITLTEENSWWSRIKVPDEIPLNNVIALETAVKNTDGTLTEITYTDAEKEDIWQKLRNAEGTSKKKTDAKWKFNTDEHKYNQWYSIEDVAGQDFFIVTNQRTGIVNMTVTKNWIDGDASVRKLLKHAFESQGWSLQFKLVCEEDENAINRTDNTINVENIGPEEKVNTSGEEKTSDTANYRESTSLKILNKDGKPVDDMQKLTMNLQIKSNEEDNYYDFPDDLTTEADRNTEKIYFYNLPKFNQRGEMLHYTVEEVVVDKDNTEMSWDTAIDQLKSQAPDSEIVDYTSTFSKSKYTIGEKLHTEDKQGIDIDNVLSGTKEIHFYKQWLDEYRLGTVERPDIYLDIFQKYHTSENADDVKLDSYYKDYNWLKNIEENNKNLDYWTATIKNLPKYDEYGYEIYYYAKEGMNVTGSNFHYKDVYYQDDVSLPMAPRHIGDEKGYDGGTKKYHSILSASSERKIEWLTEMEEGGFALKEEGTFVNQLEENIVISGKKLWGNVPAGYEDTDLPAVTFYVWQFINGVMYDRNGQIVTDTGKPGYEDEKTAQNAVAWINVSDWDTFKQDGSFVFQMEYLGENVNSIGEDGTMEVEPVNSNADPVKIPLYNDKGQRYSYEMGEDIHMPDDVAWDHVYTQPEINGYMVHNYYESKKSQLTVKKIFGDLDLKEGEHYPSITFELVRYYIIDKRDEKGDIIEEDGKPVTERVQDYAFSRSKTISYEEIESNPAGEAQCTFDNLDIYAPGGEKFEYVIRENLGDYMQGYEIYVDKGDLEVDNFTEKINSGTSSEDGKHSGIVLKDDNDTGTENVTFLNHYKPGSVKISGSKKWQDANNSAGIRPELFEAGQTEIVLSTKKEQESAGLQLIVGRYALEQPGAGNAIGSASAPLIVEPGTYKITWKRKDADSQDWTYEITGLENNPLEKYAPNGMEWNYIVGEQMAKPYSFFYGPGKGSQQSYEGTKVSGYDEQDAVGNITVDEFVNTIQTEEYIRKYWKNAEMNTPDYTDYAGVPYMMKVTYTLQARIDKAFDAAGQSIENVNKQWLNADDFLKKYLNTDAGRTYDKVIEQLGGSIIAERTGYINDSMWYSYKDEYLVKFSNLVEAIKAEKTDLDNREIKEGTYVQVKYRIVETSITYLDTDDNVLFHQDYSVKSQTGNNIDVVEYESTENSLFKPQIGSTVHRIENVLDTINLRIVKQWKDDNGNIYHTRPLSGDQWQTKFLIERRQKESTDSWETVKAYKIGESDGQDLIITMKSKNNVDYYSVIGLPKYDLKQGDAGAYTIVEYEYRARELQNGSETETLDHGDTFYDSYKVWYGTGQNAEHQKDNEDNHAILETDGGKQSYYTYVTNELQMQDEINIYAKKVWDGFEGLTDAAKQTFLGNTTVELELQYLKKDKAKDSTNDEDWASFQTRAVITLDGSADDSTGKVYYEDESWHAVWKQVPRYVQGSETEKVDLIDADGNTVTDDDGNPVKVEQTIYRVKEKADKGFCQIGKSGRGTADQPYTFTNALTSLTISKEVVLGNYDSSQVDLNKEYLFGIIAKDYKDISGTYSGVIVTDQNGTITTDFYPKIEVEGYIFTFTLRANQTATIYGLPKDVIYTVAEVKEDGFTTETQLDDGEFQSTQAEVYEGTNIIPVNNITFAKSVQDGEKLSHSVAFRNTLYGAIHIEKVDENDNPLQGVQFKVQYKEGSGDNTVLKELDADVCIDSELIGAKGVITTDASGKNVFNGLKLGVTYVVSEVSVPEGYNKLIEPFEVTLPYLTTDQPVKDSDLQPIGTQVISGSKNYVYAEVRYRIGNNAALDMPVTGRLGIFWPGITGLVMLGIGMLYWSMSERKRKGQKKLRQKS